MKRQPLILAVALVLTVLLTVVAVDNLSHMKRGYSVEVVVAMIPPEGMPPIQHQAEASATHEIIVPGWRIAAHIALWAAALIAVAMFAVGHRHAFTASLMVFGATLAVASCDIFAYGTMRSPDPTWTILLHTALVLANRHRDRLSSAAS